MVLYFDNNTGDKEYDHLSKGLADMMITDLSSVQTLQVLEREKLDELLHELKLQRTKYFDQRTAQKIGKGAGAAYVVTGAFISAAPNLRLDVRVIQLETSSIVKAATVTGEQSKFFELQQKLTAQLVEGLSAVLSADDAQKAKSATNENRVGQIDTLVQYGKGLDARDNGDLQAALQLLSRVVSSDPGFKLGKTRYMQIMKDLYAAKSNRASLLSDNEQRLLDHINKALEHGSAASSPRVLSYRVLKGQYHLTRVATALDKPASTYRDHVRAYVDNQRKLIAETKDMREYEPGSSGVSAEDVKLAEEIGIKQPGSTFGDRSPSEVMRRLNAVLMFGEPSPFLVNVMPTDRVCYYQLDSSYPKIATDAMDQALAHIAKFGGMYRERETMRSLREYARALVVLGRQEEAIVKLQSGLDQFPKSGEFDQTEQLLREILAGKGEPWACHKPR